MGVGSNRFQSLMHNECPVITVNYMFAGMGSYKEIMFEKQLPEFEAWIGANGSAFMGDSRLATEEKIRDLIALHAADIYYASEEGAGAEK